MTTRTGRHWPWWAEALMVTTLTAGAVVNTANIAVLSRQDARDGYVDYSFGADYTHPSVAAALLAGGAMALRNRLPVPAAAVVALAAGVCGWPLLPPLLVVLFTLASRGRTAEAAGWAVAVLALNGVLRPAVSLWEPQMYGSFLFLAFALVLGLWVGSRRRLVAALASQVDHLRTERALRAEAVRLSERAAIAAEMHDVLAHRLSLIALHTGVLQTHRDRLPPAVADRVGMLRTTSTEALADLRDVLGALHGSGGPDGTGPDGTGPAPAPVLRPVDDLVEEGRAAGQSIDVRVEGDAGEAPSAHRLAVFRLVREALSNARKHAPDAAVRVRVRYGPPATMVEVVNSSPSRPPADIVPSGFGLVGLRERVAALGGHFDAGPAGTDSWRIAARLPLPAGEEAEGEEADVRG